ncbi:MAG: hypothetical protein CL681_01565 [Blastopirellula sp.]|nr:hypothetical protein [Blastopirellula sp.]MAR08646.1 hypothetical protein [Blastopirellula sp.]
MILTYRGQKYAQIKSAVSSNKTVLRYRGVTYTK